MSLTLISGKSVAVTLLVTACTKLKSTAPVVSAAQLGLGSAADLALSWFKRLGQVTERVVARDLYTGRGHRLASEAAKAGCARHAILSAGVGLVRSSDTLPPYALTVARGAADSIIPHLRHGDTADEWWAAVQRLSPFARSLDHEWTSGLLIVALPLPYLQFLAPDLEQLSATQRADLRVINASDPALLPEALRCLQLPYDSRLDGPDSESPGTGSDFLGRAARHFLSLTATANQRTSDLDAHRSLVEGALHGRRARLRVQGRALPDNDIEAIIHRELEAGSGGSSALLLRLRRELGIACEQGRFRRLYATVARHRVAA